jgi:hypothetical protein
MSLAVVARASIAALVACLALPVGQVSVAASAAAQAWAVVSRQGSVAAWVVAQVSVEVSAAQAWAAVLCQDLAAAVAAGLASCPDWGSSQDLALCPDLDLHPGLVSYLDSALFPDLALCPDLDLHPGLVSYLDSALFPDLDLFLDLALCPDLVSYRDLDSYPDLASCRDSASCPDLVSYLDLVSAVASAADLDLVAAAVEDWSVPKACYSVAGCTGDSADDSSVADSPNCRRIRDGCCSTRGADDTKGAGDDRDFPISPTRCDCNKHGSSPNSIPIRPNPMAGCWRSSRQSQCRHRK